MITKGKAFFAAIILVLAAAYGGYMVGSMEGQRAMDEQYQLLNYSAWATEVKANVRLLDLIDARQYKEAGDLLETFLDIRLASLSPYEGIAGDHPDQDVFQAIEMARLRRSKHPGHMVNPKLEKNVERALRIAAKEH